jgi:hypothetical protein
MGDRPDAVTDGRSIKCNDRRPILAIETYLGEIHCRLPSPKHYAEEPASFGRYLWE